jgi:hypothetical protein
MAQGRNMSIPMVTDSLPASVDWRSRGVILPPLDQKQCGKQIQFGTQYFLTFLLT